MKSNKKLYIRNRRGKIQALPLYTDENDVSAEHMPIRDGNEILYASLVPINDPHASWLKVRDMYDNVYAVYRTGTNSEPDQLELTNDRHVLTYSGNKYNALVNELNELKKQQSDSLSDRDKAVLEKRIERAQYLVNISKYENTFYRNEFTEIPNVLVTDKLTDASLMFYGCGDLKKLDIIETGKFTCMQEMYAECHSLPSTFPFVIDMSSIKKASDVSDMFDNSSVKQVYVTNVRSDVLNEIQGNPKATIGVDKVIVSYRLTQDKYKAADIYGSNYKRIETITDELSALEVQDATSMFEGCAALKELPDIDTSRTKVMNRMFYGCKSLPSKFPWHINLTSVSKVEDLQDMFKESSVEEVVFITPSDAFASKLTPEILGKPDIVIKHTVKLSNASHELRRLAPSTYDKMKTLTVYAELSSDIINVSHMFEDCVRLESIDIGIFDDVTGLENTSFMFANCPALKAIPKIEMSTVKNASNMFSGDKALLTVPYLNLKKNKSFVNMFKGCESLPEDFPWLIDMRNVSDAAALADMFADTKVSKLGIINLAKDIRDNLDDAKLGVPTEGITFYHSPAWLKTEYGWQSIEEIPHLAVVEIRDSLSNFNNLKRIGELDFGNIELLASLFSRSNTLESIDKICNTEKLKNASSFFAGCSMLTTLPAELDFSSATNFNGMFSFCSELLNVPAIKMPAAKTAVSMFYGCQSITSLPSFSLGSIYDISSMFYGCVSLKELPELDTSGVQSMRQAFANCTSLPEKFPFAISLKSVTSVKHLENLFNDSSVQEVTFKDASEELKDKITPKLLGEQDLKINYV